MNPGRSDIDQSAISEPSARHYAAKKTVAAPARERRARMTIAVTHKPGSTARGAGKLKKPTPRAAKIKE
jgi:hypothetical protein